MISAMNAGTISPLPCQDAVFIRERAARIREDIIAGEQKIERISIRIQRDRQALLHWQARLALIEHENKLSSQ